MSTAKNAILRAKLNGVITELLVRTNTANVIVDDNGTTLAAHLATLATSASVETLQQSYDALGALAKKSTVSQSDLDSALATLITGKADQTALQAEIDRATGVEEGLDSRLTTAEVEIEDLTARVDDTEYAFTTMWDWQSDENPGDAGKSIRTIANEELAAQLIGENAQESLDTLAEIAAWIQSHPGDASAMNQAITALQNKVVLGTDSNGTEYATVKAYVEAAIAALNIGDYATAASLTALAGRVEALETKTANLGDLANKSTVTESDLDSALAEKVNAASEGNHSHPNKALLDTYTQTEADLADAVAKKHGHDNKEVLDGIGPTRVAGWDAKTTVYYAAEEPAAMVNGDLWVQIVD